MEDRINIVIKVNTNIEIKENNQKKNDSCRQVSIKIIDVPEIGTPINEKEKVFRNIIQKFL